MKRAPEKLLKAFLEAEVLKDANKINKAGQAARTAYCLALEYLPAGHPDRRRAARVLGLLLMKLNQKAEAERLLLESGDLVADGDVERQVDARNSHASLRLQQGATPEDVQQIRGNLEFASQHLAPDSVGVTMALANLGQVSEALGDIKTAERHFVEVLGLRRNRQADSELMIAALMDLARIYLRTQRVAKSEPLFQEALRLQRAEGERDLLLAITLNQYAAVCQQMGRVDEAVVHLEESLQLRRSILGADHPQVATALHGLVAVYMEIEEYDKADETLEMALRISERALGAAHPKSIQFLYERGMNLVTMRPLRADEGLEMVRRADQLASDLPLDDPIRERARYFRKGAEHIAGQLGIG